jgi:hypothetical protein
MKNVRVLLSGVLGTPLRKPRKMFDAPRIHGFNALQSALGLELGVSGFQLGVRSSNPRSHRGL